MWLQDFRGFLLTTLILLSPCLTIKDFNRVTILLKSPITPTGGYLLLPLVMVKHIFISHLTSLRLLPCTLRNIAIVNMEICRRSGKGSCESCSLALSVLEHIYIYSCIFPVFSLQCKSLCSNAYIYEVIAIEFNYSMFQNVYSSFRQSILSLTFDCGTGLSSRLVLCPCVKGY